MSDNAKKPQTDRVGIPVKFLLIVSDNPSGIRIPINKDGRPSEKLEHKLIAGEDADGLVKTEIEWRPWMRHHRVVRSRKVDRSEAGKKVSAWERVGDPFYIHETMAVPTFVEEP